MSTPFNRRSIAWLVTALGVTVLVTACLVGSIVVFDSGCNHNMHGPFQSSVPSAAPDGKLIAFDSARTGNGDIFLMTLGETNVQTLISTDFVELHPIFSRDGKTIAFARQTGGYQHVWLFRLDDKTETQLTTGRVLDLPVASSDRGFFFKRSTFRGRALLPKSELFRVTQSGGPPERLGEIECISPDERHQIRKLNDVNSGRTELWLTDGDANPLKRIGYGWDPRFAQNSQRIVYLERSTNYSDRILVANLDGTVIIEALPARQGLIGATFCLQDSAIVFRTITTETEGVGVIQLRQLSHSNISEILRGW